MMLVRGLSLGNRPLRNRVVGSTLILSAKVSHLTILIVGGALNDAHCLADIEYRFARPYYEPFRAK
jgi:hypothetical protein